MRYGIYVRNPDGTSDAEIDDFVKVDIVLRFNAVGSWSLLLPASDAVVSLAQPGMGVIIERGGAPLISGPVTQIERDWSKDKNGYVISGVGDETILWDRTAYPCNPVAQFDGSLKFAAQANDVRHGTGETVMKAYVSANAVQGGAWANSRYVAGLTVGADLGRGSAVSASPRFDVLGDLLATLGQQAGLGFRVVNKVFDVYAPADHTADVVFSPDLGNLLAYSYTSAAPKATQVIVAGGDQDVNRIFAVQRSPGAEGTWARHVELFKDERGTTDILQLIADGNTELVQDADQYGLKINPIDGEGLTYGVVYQLGDRVTVDVDGTDISDIVRQVEFVLDQDGEVIAPAVESPNYTGAYNALQIFSAFRHINRRVSALERMF